MKPKTNLKKYYFLVVLFIFILSVNAQDKRNNFHSVTNTGIFFNGELNAIYDVTLGAEIKYTFNQKTKFLYNVNSSFTTDIGTEGANLYAFSLGLGAKYNIYKIKSKAIFLSIDLGGLLLQERFATELLDNTLENNIFQFGYKADFSIGYEFIKRSTVLIGITQFSNLGTQANFGISYSF